MGTADLNQRLANLSPAKKALLELRFKQDRLHEQTIPLRASREFAPLSFAQQRLWFLNQLEPESPAYNESRAYRLSGVLDVAALQRALDLVVARHEVLRTNFVWVDGNPTQVIAKTRRVKLPLIDLSAWPESSREAEARRLLADNVRRPFDLSRDHMLRVMLLRLDEQEHILLVVKHHIASDGWSSGIFWRELSDLYRSIVLGEPCELPELPIQYADYAIWQRNRLHGEFLEAQLSYWKKQLDGVEPLRLPTDRRRSATSTSPGAKQSLMFPKKLSDGLKALSRQQGATLFMTLLAAFQALLNRYTGRTDIVVGTPIAGRTRLEVEKLIGFFVNTLVLRTDCSNDPTFRELLDRVKQKAVDAYTHQEVPFEKLVEELQPERKLGSSPLFQVTFQLHNTPRSSIDFPGLTLIPVEVASGTAKFDLSLSMGEERDGLKATLDYNTELFDGATINRMLGHLQVLLEGIVADPDRPISTLPVLTEPERHQLLVEWNDTKREYPKDECIHELFEKQADKTPDAVAVVFEGQQLTYRELNRRANHLADHLRQLGLGPGAAVGICVERSIEMIVALLGILKAGGAYVPLDSTYPRERLAFMAQDAAIRVIVGQERLLPSLKMEGVEVVDIDRERPLTPGAGDQAQAVGSCTEQLAYVMYTSGSTGQPKGVEVEQRAVVRLVVNTDYVQLGSEDVIAQVSNYSFDAATFEIWGALCNGARLVIFTRDVTLNPEEFAADLKRHGVTTLFLTTALFNLTARKAPGAFAHLRQVLFGGETADPRCVAEVLRQQGPERLIHVYGPTESTTFATWHPVREVAEGAATVPIGKPIANTTCYVLDASRLPVPIGVPGEIYIGGDGLARGYLNRPELTAEKFISNPFSNEPHARLYRTGDLARYLPDGNIEFLGRIDNQVKIRGFRVELGEIETVLERHPAVRATVVVARDDMPGEKHLVAYVVPSDGLAPLVQELRGFLKKELPDYMMPAQIVFLESMPFTPNGKIDRKALPVPVQNAQTVSLYASPRDGTEEILCRLWSEILGVNRVGIDDDFFALGGHSLLAARLFSRLDEKLDRSLPLSVLFKAPTIRLLAEQYRASGKPSDRAALIALRTGGTLPPVYGVPGILGNIVGYEELARELGSEQPFYGLQSVGLAGEAAPLGSIEEMATLYVREIRSVQSHGPYAVIGACFGATVAYEMVRQLLNAGEEVAFLGLLDPTLREGKDADKTELPLPRLVTRASALGSLITERLHLYGHEMKRLGIKERIGFLSRKVYTLGALLQDHKPLKSTQREINQIEVYRANLQALDRYRREPLQGPLRALEIFESSRPSQLKTKKGIDWHVFWYGLLSYYQMPGKDSGDMLRGENVRVLASLLARRLRVAHHPAQLQGSAEHENAQSPRQG